MLNDRLRRLMRDVARGVPLAVGIASAAALAGCATDGGGGGGCQDYTENVPITAAADAGVSDGGEADAGAPETCETICNGYAPGFTLQSCELTETEAICNFRSCFVVGRRPDAPMTSEGSVARTDLGSFLMRAVVSEAASAPAFERLARSLEALGAPEDFVRRATVSAADERRHAVQMAVLAKREVGEVTYEIEVADDPLPSLFQLALHNVREGCVGEAFAAVEAAWQAEHAPDALTRETYAQIARDEAEHALLSMDIDAWARPRLDEAERAALDEARAERLAALRDELAERGTLEAIGLPGGDAAVSLLDAVA